MTAPNSGTVDGGEREQFQALCIHALRSAPLGHADIRAGRTGSFDTVHEAAEGRAEGDEWLVIDDHRFLFRCYTLSALSLGCWLRSTHNQRYLIEILNILFMGALVGVPLYLLSAIFTSENHLSRQTLRWFFLHHCHFSLVCCCLSGFRIVLAHRFDGCIGCPPILPVQPRAFSWPSAAARPS